MANKRRFESMLFDYETTGKTDFRPGEIKKNVLTVYKEKPRCLRVRPPLSKYLQNLVDWKEPRVPFGLFVKPKDIVQTDPKTMQKPYEEIPDLELENVMKTRPRLAMTPAVNLDDVPQNERDIMIPDIYLSTVHKALQEVKALAACESVVSPIPPLPAPANPIFLKKLKPPYVAPEWRMDSVTWDERQRRGHCDPTAEYWWGKIREKDNKLAKKTNTMAIKK